eukprot:EG_transcript_42972
MNALLLAESLLQSLHYLSLQWLPSCPLQPALHFANPALPHNHNFNAALWVKEHIAHIASGERLRRLVGKGLMPHPTVAQSPKDVSPTHSGVGIRNACSLTAVALQPMTNNLNRRIVEGCCTSAGAMRLTAAFGEPSSTVSA